MINMTTMTIEKTTKATGTTTTTVKKPAKKIISASPFGVRIHDKQALMRLTGLEHTCMRRN